MPWFGATILLGAFLLFQVQPIVARAILPWFGGSAAVWSTCLVFFQVMLVAGYLYSHVLVRRLAPRRQALVHITLLAASVALLPIAPSPAWKPEAALAWQARQSWPLVATCPGNDAVPSAPFAPSPV